MHKSRLIQVTGDSVIMRHWQSFKHAILAAMPVWAGGYTEKAANRILQRLLDGGMQLWLLVREQNGENRIVAVGTTQVIQNNVTGARTMEIFSLYAMNKVYDDEWEVGFNRIQEYAEQRSCVAIVAQTENPRIVELAEKAGFNTSLRLLTKGV